MKIRKLEDTVSKALWVSFVIGPIWLFAGCREKQIVSAAASVPEVPVLQLKRQEVTPQITLSGRVEAFRIAEIRPQVGGIITKQPFEQGARVRAGQPLFQIDPTVYRAETDDAEAALNKAETVLNRARAQAIRLRDLVRDDAVSQQLYNDAHSAEVQAEADLAQSRAVLARRRVDMDYATITSPIDGRVDQANATEGALISPGQENPLAVVQQIDPVYVDLRAPLADLKSLQVAASSQGRNANIAIFGLDDNRAVASGKVLFSGISVDQTTGSVLVRVLVRNPQQALLPGMFVRAHVPTEKTSNAFLIPQQAVGRNASGEALVYVLKADGTAEARPVELGDVLDGRYLIRSGLTEVDAVVVEGQERIIAGSPVHGLPWTPTTNQ